MRGLLRIIPLAILIWAVTPGSKEIGKGDFSPKDFTDSTLTCILDMKDEMFSPDGLNAGLNYELVRRFGKDSGIGMEIRCADDSTDYTQLLKDGVVDMVITDCPDTMAVEGTYPSIGLANNTVWLVSSSNEPLLYRINTWLCMMQHCSTDYQELKQRFLKVYDPFRSMAAERTGILTSPYESIIKDASGILGWDWRLLTAVIFHESRFSINSVSRAGATGIMQVLPFTASRYGITDLLDPEQNIKAGVRYLESLQQLYIDSDITKEDRIKFTLAAYNAGHGRIADCRNLAEMLGFNHNSWEGILKTIPYMRDGFYSDGETVKLGVFQGNETIAYIETILSLYEAYCFIRP